VAGLAAEARFELRQLLQESKAGSDPGLFISFVIVPPLSSSAKADDPVRRAFFNSIADACDYWMPPSRA
jgi:hypothetical protein